MRMLQPCLRTFSWRPSHQLSNQCFGASTLAMPLLYSLSLRQLFTAMRMGGRRWEVTSKNECHTVNHRGFTLWHIPPYLPLSAIYTSSAPSLLSVWADCKFIQTWEKEQNINIIIIIIVIINKLTNKNLINQCNNNYWFI